MKRPKEWQRFNVPESQQVQSAIEFVESTIGKLEAIGRSDKAYQIGIDYPQNIVKQVQIHYLDDPRNIEIRRSFKRTGGFQ